MTCDSTNSNITKKSISDDWRRQKYSANKKRSGADTKGPCHDDLAVSSGAHQPSPVWAGLIALRRGTHAVARCEGYALSAVLARHRQLDSPCDGSS